MKKLILIAFLFISYIGNAFCAGPQFEKLFNGKDFTGFKILNGQAKFKVENGTIVGISTLNQANSFLATEKNYGDFILEFDVKCDEGINSGVQFRSLSSADYNNYRVHGYQCEIDPSPRRWSGGIYDEGRSGWLATLDNNPKGQAAYKSGQWNHYRVEALGNNLRIWLNGVNTADLYDDKTASGFIAMQVHSIYGNKNLEGKEVRWKNINILTKDVAKNREKGELAKVVNLIPNTLTQDEKQQGWELLFDGKSIDSMKKFWRNDNKPDFPKQGWTVKDGVLSLAASNGKEWEIYGNIITKKEYSAFEFSVEFMLTPGANSGIKYFTIEDKHGDRPSCFGLEYQLLDDKLHKDAKLYTTYPGSRTLGSLYDLIAASDKKRFNGIGKWNKADIIAYPDGRVEHFLNGRKILEYNRNSKDFADRLAHSKYKNKEFNEGKYPFGMAPKGHILLQDHGNLVYFRSIKVKDLSK